MNQFFIILAGLSLIQASICSAMDPRGIEITPSAQPVQYVSLLPTGKKLPPETVHGLSYAIAVEYCKQRSNKYANKSWFDYQMQDMKRLTSHNDARLNKGLSATGFLGYGPRWEIGIDATELDNVLNS